MVLARLTTVTLIASWTAISGGAAAQDSPDETRLVRPGDIVAANLANHQVSVFDGDSGVLRGALGATDGDLRNPTGVAFGPDGALYVSSSGNDRILRYDPESGRFLGTFASGDPLTRPFSLAFGPEGTLYVSSGRSVLEYGRDGTLLGAAASGMQQPIGLAFGSDGLLYVANSTERNVLRFDPATRSVPTAHTTDPIPFVSDVAFGPDGALYASSASSGRVLRFTGGPGTEADVVAQLPEGGVPMGLAFRAGRLIIGDFAMGRLFSVDPTQPESLRELTGEGLARPENIAVRPFVPPQASTAASACADTSVFTHQRAGGEAITWGERATSQGITRQPFTFPGPDGRDVPAMLWQQPGDGSRPIVILAHGMPGTRTTLAAAARRYAHAGAAVISITAPFSRSDSPIREPALFTLPHFDERDRLELVEYVRDVRRLLDLLPAIDGGDPNQVVFVGHSFGGIVGAILAGVEPRIRAYALVSAPWGLRARFPGRWSAGEQIDLLGPRPLSSDRWARHLADVDARCFLRSARPGSVLLQFGRDDEIVTPAAAREVADAAPPGTAIRWYEADHAPTEEVWVDQIAWMAEHVRLRPDEVGI